VTSGLLVAQMDSGGAADKAGLQAAQIYRQRGRWIVQGGDVIVAVDGHPVATRNDLQSYLEDHHQPGDTITLSIVRGGAKLDVPLTLAEQVQT
jgi:2-alkenal reductase